MRRTFAIAAGLLLLVPAAPSRAHETGQEVVDTVIAPPLPAKSVSRGGRSLVIISQMLGINGVGGYYFEPSADTLGGPFVLKPAGRRDVDVFFYESLGNLVDQGPNIVGEHSSEDTNGEKGFVPGDTKWVVIYYGTCIADCVPSGGVPAYVSFMYRAEKTPVVTIEAGVEELGRTEIHVGGSVYLNNLTGEEITVRSQALGPDGETPLFSTDPFTGKILFDLSTFTAGEYPYTTSTDADGTLVIA